MNYFEIKFEKICKNCQKEFSATEKQTLCDKCRKKVQTKNRNNSFKIIKQDVHCKYCEKYIFSIEKKQTRKIELKLFTKVCDKCKVKNRIKKSEMMKINNPMKNKNIVQKNLITKYGKIPNKTEPLYKQLGYESFVNYMKSKDNPMKNKDISEKVKNTLRRRINNGEILYKKGVDHHNFKGLRRINKAIRDDLKDWRKKILDDCNYECVECNINNNKLHVHHTEQLHLIILSICKKNNVNIEFLKDGTKEFNLIKNEVLLYHNENNIGIALCEDCHDLIDIHYHKMKKNEN